MGGKINDQKILANVESHTLGQSVEKRIYISCSQDSKEKTERETIQKK